MLKLIFFLVVLGIFVGPVFLFIKLLQKKNIKQRDTSWDGTLVDKQHDEVDDDSAYTKDIYTLHFKTTDGEKITLHVPEKVFNLWKKGDKAKKTAGQMYPQKA